MALINCSECDKKISDKAKSCPGCGLPLEFLNKQPQKVVVASKPQSGPVPARRKTKKEVEDEEVQLFFTIVISAAFIGAVIIVVSKLIDNAPINKHSDPVQVAKDKACSESVSCIAEKEGFVAAGVYCKDKIEKAALHSVRWTDGTLELKFSQARWKNGSPGVITYLGDKVEFQNGYGAYSPMTYECDMMPSGTNVLAVRVSEGRL